jgi:hypothetical protein
VWVPVNYPEVLLHEWGVAWSDSFQGWQKMRDVAGNCGLRGLVEVEFWPWSAERRSIFFYITYKFSSYLTGNTVGLRSVARLELWFTALCLSLVTFPVSWSYAQSALLHGRMISPSQGRYLHTGQHQQNEHTHPFLEWDSNPRLPVFELTETVYTLDRAATVVGIPENRSLKQINCCG